MCLNAQCQVKCAWMWWVGLALALAGDVQDQSLSILRSDQDRWDKSFKILTLSVQVFINIFIYSVLNIFPYKEKDSPQPQVPEIFGLLNTNSEDNFVSMKSISVPGKKQIVIIKQSGLLRFIIFYLKLRVELFYQ